MSGKVAIVSVADKKHMTMVSSYTELLEREGIEYDIICMDRYGDAIREKENKLYAFNFQDNSGSNKAKKALAFLRFYFFARRIIHREKYSFIITWNENTAALFSGYLTRHYNGRYCVNQRDIDFLSNNLIKKLYAKAVYHSAFSTTCIPDMENFPSGYDYTLLLSKNDKIIKTCEVKQSISSIMPIKISYIGKVRFIDADRELMRAFANDERFQLQFIGAGSEVHKDFIEENNIKNVNLIGRYQPDETREFLKDADIIDAYYGMKHSYYRYFVPIRFGYAPALNIPILVAKDTYMDSIGSKYGFSYAVNSADCKDGLADAVYSWYENLKFHDFAEGCTQYCNHVDEVNRKFESVCLKALE